MAEAPQKGWWQKVRLSDGTIAEKKLHAEPAALEKTPHVPKEPSVVEETTQPTSASAAETMPASPIELKVMRERWTEDEQKLIFRGMRALQSKDTNGKRFYTVMDDILRKENLVIDEMSFFRDYGAYSVMMPDELQEMLDLVAEYRKVPSSADMRVQEYADEIETLIKKAQTGDVSPNRLKELHEEILWVKDQIQAHEESVPENELTAAEEADLNATTDAKPRKQRKLVNRPWQDKLARVEWKNTLKKKWKLDANRQWSRFTEEFMVLFTQKLQWGGEGTSSKIAAETDDVFHAADGIVTMRNVISGETLAQVYAFDTTDAAEYGIQKTANTLRFIDLALLSTLEFGETSADIHGVESQGMQRLVPRLNYVISRPLVAEIAILFKNGRYDALAVHPIQLMILKQAQAQVAAFIQYVDTEYQRDTRRAESKVKIINSFARLDAMFTEAIEEREAVLREALDDLLKIRAERELDAKESEMLAVLVNGNVLWTGGKGNEYGETYDTEHEKYMRVFRPDRTEGRINDTDDQRTRAWWRLMALTEKYPALRIEEESGEKKPVPMTDKRRTMRGRIRRVPRGEAFLSGTKKDERQEDDTLNTEEKPQEA